MSFRSFPRLFLACFAVGLAFCTAAPVLAQGTLVFDSLEHEGYMRQYFVFEPSGYDGSAEVPLVLNLHGAGSTAAEQLLYSKLNTVADTAGFLVAYPDAVDNFWNSGLPLDPGVVLPDDVSFLSALLDTLELRYAVDEDRIYSTGMSNGGFMSHRLACEMPGRLAAIASVTGSMAPSVLSACSPGEAVPVFQIHGTSDLTVPYAGAAYSAPVEDVVDFWVANNDCPEGPGAGPYTDTLPDIAEDNTVTISRRWLACQDWSEVLLYKVNMGGHTWPGSFPLPGAGNTAQDYLAHTEIWAFFRRHNRGQVFTGLHSPSPDRTAPLLWPNPGRSWLQLDAPAGSLVHAWDATGRLQATWRMPQSGERIQTGHWPAGLYWIQVEGAAAQSWVKMD